MIFATQKLVYVRYLSYLCLCERSNYGHTRRVQGRAGDDEIYARFH